MVTVLARFRRDDRGGVAATIVLFPLFAVIAFVFVQAMLWQRDRDLAAAATDRASSAIALYDAGTSAAQDELEVALRSLGLENVSVSVDRGDDVTVVEASGDAPGILIGTSVRVHARSVTPTDRYVAP
jgi:Flp pilus assembly protein TadG